jgi:hypothetical protein
VSTVVITGGEGCDVELTVDLEGPPPPVAVELPAAVPSVAVDVCVAPEAL